MRNLLRFTLITSFYTTIMVYAYRHGFFQATYEADFTKISCVIMGIISLVYLRLLYSACRVDLNPHLYNSELLSTDWFLGSVCTKLGLAGTVIGMIYMWKDFASVDISNHVSTLAFIKDLGAAMSTALYTTLWGIIGQVMIDSQCQALEVANET